MVNNPNRSRRKVVVTTTPTVGFDPTLEPADAPKPSAEAMHACRVWWPYSPVMRESMARVLDGFAAQTRSAEADALAAMIKAFAAYMQDNDIHRTREQDAAWDRAHAVLAKARGED